MLFFFIWKFFTPVLVDGFLLDSGWHQFSSSLQDSSQYSGCSLDGLHKSSNFQVLQSLYQSFGVRCAPITIGFTVIFMLHIFFISLARSGYLFLLSLSFSFTQWSVRTAKSTNRQVLSGVFFSFFFSFVDYHSVWPSGRD